MSYTKPGSTTPTDKSIYKKKKGQLSDSVSVPSMMNHLE